MRYMQALAITFTGLLLAAGCTKAETPEDAAAKPVAVIDGTSISRDVWNLYVKTRFSGKTPGDLTAEQQSEALEELIGMYAGAKEAEKQKLAAGEPSARLELVRQSALAEMLFNKYVEGKEPTEEELKAEYDKRVAELPKAEYHARHILVDDEAVAKDLIAQLDKGASFEKLAEANSKDGSAADGGGIPSTPHPLAAGDNRVPGIRCLGTDSRRSNGNGGAGGGPAPPSVATGAPREEGGRGRCCREDRGSPREEEGRRRLHHAGPEGGGRGLASRSPPCGGVSKSGGGTREEVGAAAVVTRTQGGGRVQDGNSLAVGCFPRHFVQHEPAHAHVGQVAVAQRVQFGERLAIYVVALAGSTVFGEVGGELADKTRVGVTENIYICHFSCLIYPCAPFWRR